MSQPSQETAPLNVVRGGIETIIRALVILQAHQPPVAKGLTDEVADLITAATRLREIWFTDYD